MTKQEKILMAKLIHLCTWTLAVLNSEKWDTSLQVELRDALKMGNKIRKGSQNGDKA